MKFVIILLSIAIANTTFCSSDKKITVSKDSASVNFKVTGKKFFIDHKGLAKTISKEDATVFVKDLQVYLKEIGYVESKLKKSAHLLVYLYSGVHDQRSSGPFSNFFKGGSSSRSFSHTKVIKNGKVIENSFTKVQRAFIALSSRLQEYGKRPSVMSSLALYSPEDTWMSYEKTALKKYKENLVTLFPKAPKSNMKMKGHPGCYPLFGYRCTSSGEVVEITSGLPAQKSGLKVGDILIGLDSTFACGGKTVDNDVYKNLLTVPLKFKRKSKTFRVTIKPQVTCI